MSALTDEKQKEIRKLEDLLKESITRIIECWESGEGDLMIEIRDDSGDRKAKIKGGYTTRIK